MWQLRQSPGDEEMDEEKKEMKKRKI